MKAVFAEAKEGIGAFIDLVQETADFIYRFSAKVVSVKRELFSAGKSAEDL